MPPGILDNPDRPFDQNGSPTRPIHHTGRIASPTDERLASEADIIQHKAFSGRWQTYIENNRLMIPRVYHNLLRYGGVITRGTDKHLMLFGNDHWQQMKLLLAKHIGINPNSNAVVRHIYGQSDTFDKLNDDGSITLTPEMALYAGLKDKVAMIGLIYYAEVYDMADYSDIQLSPDDIRNLALALA